MKFCKTSILLTFISFVFISVNAQDGDFKLIKERVVAQLMTSVRADDLIDPIINKMNEDGSFNDINYVDLSRTAGFPHRHHTYNLVHLANAYNSSSSKYFHNETIKEVITRGLKYWTDNDFFGDNWHNNQISTPTNLVNLMLLIGDEMPRELVEKAQPMIGRAHMNASGARPSGDRIVIAGILAKNLLFIGEEEKFADIIELIEGEVKFSTGSRGMQHDFSFHHRVDRVNNTTSYGYTKYANAFGEWSSYVAKTKYAFSVKGINHLIDYYLDGIFKQQVYGKYTDISVKNRSITHRATFAPRPVEEIYWLMESTDYRKDELEEIISLRKGTVAPSQSFAKFFWQTEHFVFQRPDFYTTVRMFSTRNRNMEVPYNGPGKPTHHRADGTNYLQLRGDEYHNIWPVYDWQKISGTTIVQKEALHPPTEIQKDGFTDFVGAVTDGVYGAVAFDFISPHDFVKAKKSWFFFDNEYVCLGTAINLNKKVPVTTTINQVLMRSDVSISSEDGGIEKLENESRKLENVKWVHQDKVGYIFPEPTTINLSNQTETGRWSDITDQKNISDEIVSEEVFTLWFDHGVRPNDALYAYIVVPNIELDDLQNQSSNNSNIEILFNTATVQAVTNTELEISQLAFYKSGKVNVTDNVVISMDSQGMAMLKMEGDEIIQLSVSDPSRKLSKLLITVTGIYDVNGEYYQTISDPTKNSTLIMVDLPQGVYAGMSVSVTL